MANLVKKKHKMNGLYIKPPILRPLDARIKKDLNGDCITMTGKNWNMTKCLTKDIPANVSDKFERASIVLFSVKDGVIYYLYCIDAKYKEITDPGGGLFPNEHFVSAATRELYEETIGIFDFTDSVRYIINNSIAYYNDSMVTIYQPVDVVSFEDTYKCFRVRYWKAIQLKAKKFLLENSSLLWISEPDLRQISMGCCSPKLPPAERTLLSQVFRNNTDAYPTMFNLIASFTRKVLLFGAVV